MLATNGDTDPHYRMTKYALGIIFLNANERTKMRSPSWAKSFLFDPDLLPSLPSRCFHLRAVRLAHPCPAPKVCYDGPQTGYTILKLIDFNLLFFH